MPMKHVSVLNEERRRAIVDFVNQNGRALVRELARKFGSSEITIRRDLELLHEHGLIYRTHGGALPIRAGSESDRDLTQRELQHPREKLKIAAAAARMIKEGQSIILDSGSTTTAVARVLRDFKQLTVITNAINIAGELAGSSVDVILTGGMLRKNSYSLVGPIAEESLRRLKADILFLGVDGFDTQSSGSTVEALDGKYRGACGGCLRLQQVRTLEPVVDRADLKHPWRDHRQADSETGPPCPEESRPGDCAGLRGRDCLAQKYKFTRS